MRNIFVLQFSQNSDLTLRAIEESDCENLRKWKNANRFSFFFQEDITPDMQVDWFEKYLARADDYMFMVVYQDQAIGCMGFRLLDGQADIYNVILGELGRGGKGLMGQALHLMCSFIHANFVLQIGLKVLRTNPAVDWYRENGFIETASRDTYLELSLEPARFHPRPFERLEPQSQQRQQT